MKYRPIVFGAACVALAGCGSGGSGPETPPLNAAPILSAVGSKQTPANGSSDAFTFSVTDESPDTVTLAGTSSNDVLVPAGGIAFGGAAASRTVTITPEPDLTGVTDIVLTATDSSGLSAARRFTLTVVPEEVSLQVFSRTTFEQEADGEPDLINAVEFMEDTQSEDFADLFD